jgi:hypothetical protein
MNYFKKKNKFNIKSKVPKLKTHYSYEPEALK